MSESRTGIADEIFVAITHGDIETYPEDWDAMVASLGPERMDAERRHLERLGRKVAFWAIFGLAVTILSWWILGGARW